MFKTSLSFLIVVFLAVTLEACNQSPTTISGTKKPTSVCSGQLIFEDNFNNLDESKWQHETTLAGGGNWEFQWYLNHRDNSFTKNANECTNSDNYGCERQGTPDNIINPIRSARLRTLDSFSFKYGTLEVRAKMPAGDWLWPAIWLLPTRWVYGSWPASGEIDLVEARGNRRLFTGNTNVGTEQVGSTLHFGPRPDVNGFLTAHYEKNSIPPYSDRFHTYKMVWTQNDITFSVDNEVIGKVEAGRGFWVRGNFQNSCVIHGLVLL